MQQKYRILERMSPDNITKEFVAQEMSQFNIWHTMQIYSSLESAKQYIDNLHKQIIHEYTPSILND